MSQEKSKKSDQSSQKKQKTAKKSPDIDVPAAQAKTRPLQPKDKTRPTAPYNVSEAGGPLSEIDEGPRPGPVDEVQEVLFDAAEEGISSEVDIEDLPEPVPELDEGPRPGPVDEVQEALFEATREGAPMDLDFDELPGPGLPPSQKVIKFGVKIRTKDTNELPESEASPESIPLPEFPSPDPGPTVFDFTLLLTLFVTFRFLTLLLLRPGGFIRDWSDFDTYFGIAALSDYSLFPFLDFWLEWPPLIPWLVVGIYKLSLLLPPWLDDPRFWFILLLGSVFVLFEVGNFILIYRLARRLFEAPAAINRVLWLYAGLFPPIYAMLGFFDGIALFFILLALDLLLDDRRIPSAISIGVGFMVKIIPLIMLPVAFRFLWQRHHYDKRELRTEAGLFGVVFGLTVLVLLAPFLIAGPEWVLASARSILGRASWETVWAVIEGYYGFGAVLGDRLNPAETNFAVHAGGLPWWLVSLFFVGLYGYIFSRPANLSQPRHVVAFAGLTAAIFLLYNKGYSPQFLVYLLPFILLLFPNSRGLAYALILTGLNVLEQPIYFVLLPDSAWLLIFTVVMRFVLIAVLALEFALVLWPSQKRLAPLAKLRPSPLVLAGLSLFAILVLVPVLLRAHAASYLARSPVISVFAGFMQIQAADVEVAPSGADKPRLLLSDQATYRQIYPYLSDDFDLQLADGATRYSGAPSVDELLQGFDAIWILPTGAQEQALRNTVAGRGQLLAAYDFEGLGLASLYGLQGDLTPFIAPARFAGGIELLSYQVQVRSGAVEVTLYWRARNPQTQSLTVFTQLLDAEGQWVAGHDSWPANGTAPTTTWPLDSVQADPHRIELPADLPPGEYSLVTGLYNDFRERLHGIDPDGTGFTNRVVPLEILQLP